MSNRTVAYDCRNYAIVICGIPIDDGLTEGGFFKLSPESEAFGVTAGADGHVVRYLKAGSNLRKWELTLLQTSSHNAQLSILHALDVESKNGAGIGPFLLKDKGGTTLVGSDVCFITKAPDLELGAEVKDLTWEGYIVVPHSAALIGGN